MAATLGHPWDESSPRDSGAQRRRWLAPKLPELGRLEQWTRLQVTAACSISSENCTFNGFSSPAVIPERAIGPGGRRRVRLP